MGKLVIQGGNKLNGEVYIHGAKNSVLPILSATICCAGECVIHNCPKLSDVDVTIKILEYLGARVKREDDNLTIDTTNVNKYDIPDLLMREMRSSIVFLSSIISRFKKAKLSFPGGCELGPRPIDLHLKALQQMGLVIEENHGVLDCRVDGRLRGAHVALSFPSVGATENIMIAASLAEGETVITNAAREPEICDLADYLIKSGAKIKGAGEGAVIIEGVKTLNSTEHNVIPDRIAATTFMAAVSSTGGNIILNNVIPSHLNSTIPIFKEAGCNLKCFDNKINIISDKKLKPIKIVRTMPYPGFPTDMQPQMAVTLALASGTSMVTESIFENRFKYVDELARMGSHIKVEGNVAVIDGVAGLTGAQVNAPDLRAGAALVIAGLAAEGYTVVDEIGYIQRGYECFEEKLQALGAVIEKVDSERAVQKFKLRVG